MFNRMKTGILNEPEELNITIDTLSLPSVLASKARKVSSACISTDNILNIYVIIAHT